MKRLFFALGTQVAVAALWVISQSAAAGAQGSSGEANFNRLCAACHTIGGGKRLGPDLLGIGQRRSEEWLLKWIASSQSMIRGGDPTAVALYDEFNKMPMPDCALPPDGIKGILAFIASKSGGQAAAAAPAAPAQAATSEEVRIGRELFQGGTTLSNGGPACSACHYVTPDAVVGGGVLAKELTTASSRLGAQGVSAILSAPPFPVMQQAYQGRPLSEGEIAALVGYLQNVSERPQTFDQPREDGIKLLVGGLAGLGALMPLYSYVWRLRKKDPVNRKVFDRQVRSQ